jgi:hypothetical protein
MTIAPSLLAFDIFIRGGNVGDEFHGAVGSADNDLTKELRPTVVDRGARTCGYWIRLATDGEAQ